MKNRNILMSLWCLLFFLATPTLWSQSNDFRFRNEVYVDYIKSVKFHLDGLFLTQPIIDLGSNAQLILSFDDLTGDNKNFTYRIIHCNRNWEPSEISEMEYLDGFSEERITDYNFSYKTLANYVHYEVLLPHPTFSWTKSGNYLLVIYEDEYEKIPVITRRFMVVEPRAKIFPQITRPAQASRTRTHQEIDFEVLVEGLNLRIPRQEVTATIVQNGRWDQSISDIPPLFDRQNRLIFDYQNQITFPAGKEFRPLDIRSVRYQSNRIERIDEFIDRYEIIMMPETERINQVAFNYKDLNGNFIIENADRGDHDLSGNYLDVFLGLQTGNPIPNQSVCLVGGFSDWLCYAENLMEYNDNFRGYVGRMYLKQGYYDYAFGVIENPEKMEIYPELTTLEGDWYETNNEYTIFVYYRPFGARYDRLIGAVTFSSSLP